MGDVSKRQNAVSVKAGAIFNMLGHMAAGAIPVIGDAVDLYELFSGRNIFTGEKLSAGERALTALGLLAGSGAYRRNIAKGIDKEAARLGLGGVKKSADDAVIKIEKHAADKSSVSALTKTNTNTFLFFLKDKLSVRSFYYAL